MGLLKRLRGVVRLLVILFIRGAVSVLPGACYEFAGGRISSRNSSRVRLGGPLEAIAWCDVLPVFCGFGVDAFNANSHEFVSGMSCMCTSEYVARFARSRLDLWRRCSRPVASRAPFGLEVAAGH